MFIMIDDSQILNKLFGVLEKCSHDITKFTKGDISRIRKVYFNEVIIIFQYHRLSKNVFLPYQVS